MKGLPSEDENENVSEGVNISETGPRKKTMRITYRVTPVEYQTMMRIADFLFKNGSIKINSPSALARAAAFTQINIFLHYEAKVYEAEFHKRRIRSTRSYNYVPPPGTSRPYHIWNGTHMKRPYLILWYRLIPP